VPDGLFRAQLAQPAAGKAAADGEGQGNPLARDQGGGPDHEADNGSGVGAGQEASQERAGQGQVGGVVVEEEPGEDAGGQRHAEAGGKNQPLGPVAFFGQEDAPEPREAHQHGGEHGHDGELHHQGDEEELLRREVLGFVEHEPSDQDRDAT
jgi:hypothetical protein